MKYSFVAATLVSAVMGQGVGTSQAETHPSLSVKINGQQSTQSIVLDANWRWVHNTGGYTNCYTGNKWDATLCPDDVTCAKNCVLDGADYSGTYGITSSGNALTLSFKTNTNVGSRTYLLDSTGSKYQTFMLKNNEFTFTVDVSKLGCGINGALYFVPMDADGGMAKYPTNTAGAKYGTGYCDSQCPRDLKFIAGKANAEGWNGTDANSGTGQTGSCCPEMDIWEANSFGAAFTPHPCSVDSLTTCDADTDCSYGDGNRYKSVCDPDGCDFNSYRMGNTTFYGAGLTIDTNKPIEVVTQFITADGTDTGDLSEIRRIYVQGGKVIQNSASEVAGVTGNSLTESWCKAQKTAFGDTDSFDTVGGLTQMGKNFETPQVLVMSIWDDHQADMLWLDSTYPVGSSGAGKARGTCSATSGDPDTVESEQSSAKVTYSNIKFGPLNSTYAAADA